MGGQAKHTEEFERRAVELFANRGRRSVDDIAAQLGVSSSRLYVWRAKYAGRPDDEDVAPEYEEYEEPSERTGYSRESNDPQLASLRGERDRLKVEAAALRKTIVLLGRRD